MQGEGNYAAVMREGGLVMREGGLVMRKGGLGR